MRDFTKRRGKADIVRGFLLGVGAIVLLLAVTFGAVHAAWGMYDKFAEAANSNEAAQQNLMQMKEQESSVRAEVANLSSKEGQEAQLRQSYGVALPGEHEIQIVRQASSSPEATPSQKGSILIRILKALFVW